MRQIRIDIALALIDNLDVARLLVKGNQEEVENTVRQAIRDAANEGGYILISGAFPPIC
jgi:hypothetical protein